MTRQFLAAAAALAGVLVMSLRAWQTAQLQDPSPPQALPEARFEYVFVEEWGGETVNLCYARANGCEWRYVRIPNRDHLSAAASATAQLGAQGWDLVTSNPYPGQYSQTLRMTFRRAIR